ncbi:MAG: S49 family peptidase, partial [Porphyromonadaceae bacterium]|nr:S49 family peptidase [Porphyromonadaceae bacterium]
MKSFLKTFLASLLAVVVGGVILLCLSMFLIVGLVVGISSQFASSDITSIEPHSILKISATSLPEVAIQDNFMSYLQGEKSNDITLNEAIRAINEAKDNDNIDGIYLCNADIPNGLPTIRAFRSAIEEFKKSGKFVISYGDIYSQKGYYLSSVAPEIYLNPSGVLEINGIGSQTMFYKEALNKLGVQMNI